MSLQGNPETARAFLDRSFSHVTEPGLIEIAYSGSDGGAITRARQFENTPEGRIEAAAFATEINRSKGVNVYFAPSLRNPDTPKGKRAKKINVLGSPMVWADFDEPGSAQACRPIYEKLGIPHSIVVTGRAPELRAQAFWSIDGLVTDQGELDEMLAGVHVGLDFHADPKVVNADRVMRLPGCISWPKPGKEGRIAELTELHAPTGAPSTLYSIEAIKAAYPPKEPKAARKGLSVEPGEVAGDLLSSTPPNTPPAPTSSPPTPPAPTQPQAEPGFQTPQPTGERSTDLLGRQIDGRDEYAMNVIRRAIPNLANALGRWPTAEELFQDAWPTIEAKTAPKNPRPGESIADGLEREGRGRSWFWEKCGTHIRRATEGAISGIETVEKAQAEAQQKALEAPAPSSGPPAPISVFAQSWTRPVAFSRRDFSSIPRRKFLYGKHYIRKFVSATIAPGGVGKSTLGIVEALAMTSGRDLLGVPVPQPLRVAYFNLEDPLDEIERRIAAAMIHYKIPFDELGGRLFPVSGRDQEIKIGASTREGTILNDHLIEHLTAFCKEEKIDVLVLDPFVSAHDVNENDNNAIDAVAKSLAAIAEECNLAVELVHHSRKAASGEVERETTDDDARGAGALKGAVRAMRMLNRMSHAEAQRFGVPEQYARSYVKIGDGKQNLSPPAEKATWFHLLGVPLPNGSEDDSESGDVVAIVEKWAPPDPFDGITTEHLADVKRLVQGAVTDGLAYRESPKSDHWLGFMVAEICEIDVHSDGGLSRVKHIIRTWEKNGQIERFDGRDEKSNVRKCYKIGPGQ